MSSLPLPSVALEAERPACVTRGFPNHARFLVHARAEPGVMSRVLELFAKRGLVPQRWHSDRSGPDDAMLTIEIEAPGLALDVVDYVADCMRQIIGVERVASGPRQAG